jgi:hypothetical protein
VESAVLALLTEMKEGDLKDEKFTPQHRAKINDAMDVIPERLNKLIECVHLMSFSKADHTDVAKYLSPLLSFTHLKLMARYLPFFHLSRYLLWAPHTECTLRKIGNLNDLSNSSPLFFFFLILDSNFFYLHSFLFIFHLPVTFFYTYCVQF